MKRLVGWCLLGWVSWAGCAGPSPSGSTPTGSGIEAIWSRPLYRGARWGLRVADADTGLVVLETSPEQKFFIGSVRKLFSVGLLLHRVGGQRAFDTPVFRTGPVDGQGRLQGHLVVVPTGDLAMGVTTVRMAPWRFPTWITMKPTRSVMPN